VSPVLIIVPATFDHRWNAVGWRAMLTTKKACGMDAAEMPVHPAKAAETEISSCPFP